MEEPVEDVAEQQFPAVPDADDDPDDIDDETAPDEPPWEADPTDVAEQRRPVPVTPDVTELYL